MSRVFKLRQRSLLALIVLLAALLVGETVVLAATVKSGGPVRAVKVAVEDNLSVLTIENVWADVPGMSVTMNVPSGEKGLFLITFSAETQCLDQAATDTLCQVRALVDARTILPQSAIFDSAPDGEVGALEMNSMQFVAGPLNAGNHTVRIQSRVGGTNSGFGLNHKTLSVLRSRV